MESLIYCNSVCEVIKTLEKRYNEKIECFPFIPYEQNIKYHGEAFSASIYRLPVTGCYEITSYKISKERN